MSRSIKFFNNSIRIAQKLEVESFSFKCKQILDKTNQMKTKKIFMLNLIKVISSQSTEVKLSNIQSNLNY